MASNFDRWEKDPFFSAAEEVQESTDRMESAYRTWVKADSSGYDMEELRRDLHTALGTAKWQLEEFDRAVRSSYIDSSAKEAKTRHCQFVAAISNQIATVENSLRDSAIAEGQTELSWVRLNEGESDELALFLTGFPAVRDVKDSCVSLQYSKDENEDRDVKDSCISLQYSKDENEEGAIGRSKSDCLKNSEQSCSQEKDEDRSRGHRRTASATADIGAWNIAVNEEKYPRPTSDGAPDQPPPRVVSFSGFLNTLEQPMSKIKWTKNGFRKWKLSDRHQASDTIPLHSNAPLHPNTLTRGIDACYERSKSCLDSCDDSYDKPLYGCLGAFQRQLQRSQYQIQYSRPVQLAFWLILVLCLVVLFTMRAV